jgi:transposase
MAVLLKHINTQQALPKKNNQKEDEGLGRSSGGLSSKIHCLADGLGNPVDFMLTGGEVHDSQCADALLEGKKADFIVADKAYDNNAVLQKIAQMEAIAVIPPKSNRKEQRDFDKHYYKDRNLIERFFCRLKQFRGIATRYCKRGKYFLEAVKFASSIILMA